MPIGIPQQSSPHGTEAGHAEGLYRRRLATSTISLLREHKRVQNESRLAYGPTWADRDLVFPGPYGDYWPARDIYRLFKATVEAAKLTPLRFHDLRHTAATLVLRAGINPKMVSERLGHATVAFTLDAYSHVLPDIQPNAAEALSAALRRTN